MALIVQRARVRAFRRGGLVYEPSLSGSLAVSGEVDFGSPPNRATRRALARRRLLAAAAVPALVLAVFGLNALGPRSQQAAVPVDQPSAASSLSTSGTTGGYAALATPGFPGGVVRQSVDAATPAPRVAAVLAADLWQAANAVYQANVLGAVNGVTTGADAPAVHTPVGPTLDELIRAQARLAVAQLVLSSLQQQATDDQIATARAAVAEAQNEIDQAQKAAAQSAALIEQSKSLIATATAANPATAATAIATSPVATVTPEQIAGAQADVDRARAALTSTQHPYTEAQIAAATSQVASAQQALNAALARSAVAATAVAVKPTVAAPTVAPTPAATPVPTSAAASVPSALDAPGAGASSAPNFAGDGAVAGQSRAAGGAGDPAASTAPAAGADAVQQRPFHAGDGEATTGRASAASSVAPVPTAAPVAPVAPPAAVAPVAPPAAAPSPTTAVAPGQGATSVEPADDITALVQRLTLAQQTLAIYTAPPDAQTIQFEQDALTAAEQRLAALQAGMPGQTSASTANQPAVESSVAAAVAAPAATPITAPSATATPDAADAAKAPPTLDEAKQTYDNAVMQLQWLSVRPDASTVQAAEDEYTSAKQAFSDLVTRADASLVHQLDSDPQSALQKVGITGDLPAITAGRPFTPPAVGPITSYFGPSHPLGIDIGQGLGLPVRAAASGVVTFSGGDPCCSYGYYVDIQHAGGYMTRYGHLLTVSFLKSGDKVVQGQIIGVSGSTGFSTGPHLHFEIRLNGIPLDPLRLLVGVLPAAPLH